MKLMLGKVAAYLESKAHSFRVAQMRAQHPGIDPTFGIRRGTRIYGSGRLELGPQSYLNSNSTIDVQEGSTIRIGRGTRIGPNVHIMIGTVDPDADGNSFPLPVKVANITIGDWVWIGAGSFVGPGVTIGDNAVVGACSVVAHDVAPFEIVGGVPARRIRWKTRRIKTG